MNSDGKLKAAVTIANNVCKLASIYAFLSATRPTLPIPWIFYLSGRRTHGFVAATVPNDKPSHILIIFIPTYNCNNQETHISTQWAVLIPIDTVF